MVIVQATMWPKGNPLEAYEILNVTITNQTAGEDTENYYAHVLARPQPFVGIQGYQAEVDVRDHTFRDGFAPLLMAVLGQAHGTTVPAASGQRVAGVELPPTRRLARVELVEPYQFEAMLRRRS